MVRSFSATGSSGVDGGKFVISLLSGETCPPLGPEKDGFLRIPTICQMCVSNIGSWNATSWSDIAMRRVVEGRRRMMDFRHVDRLFEDKNDRFIAIVSAVGRMASG